jgi:hypothetical protein
VRRAAGAAACLAALGLAACDGGSGRTGSLAWSDGGPSAYRPADLPRDHVVGGKVRNDSLRQLQVLASDVRLRDARGDVVKGVARFTFTPGHSLYPPTRVASIPFAEQLRMGIRVRMNPGDEVPLMVAWRDRPGAAQPVSVDYGQGTLPIDAARAVR